MRRIGLWAFVLIVATVGCSTSPGPHRAPHDPRPVLAEQFRAIRDAGAVGAWYQIQDEHGVWNDSAGTAEAGRDRAIPADARFRIGSITKMFVAAVVLQLVAEARLHLDDRIIEILPRSRVDPRVTVRHLLGHTSGSHDFQHTLPLPPDRRFFENRWRTWTLDELITRGLSRPPAFTPPGSRFGYSSTGYFLLAQAVRSATGRDVGVEIRERLLTPLGLRSTTLPGARSTIGDPHPHGYAPIDHEKPPTLVDHTEMNPSMLGPAGEMISTTTDLNRFTSALVGGRIIPADLLTTMMEPSTPGGRFGLGLSIAHLSCGVRLVGHDGDAVTYQSWSYTTTAQTRRQITIGLTPDFRADLDDQVDRFLDTVFCMGTHDRG